MRAVAVSRTLLGLPDLQLWQTDPLTYVLPENTFNMGEQTEKRLTTDNELTIGRHMTAAAESTRMGQLTVHCFGTEITLQDNMLVVLNALRQFRYVLEYQWGPLSGTWQCEKADYALGVNGQVEDIWIARNNDLYSQAIVFTIPHIRLAGL